MHRNVTRMASNVGHLGVGFPTGGYKLPRHCDIKVTLTILEGETNWTKSPFS